jgi:predicted ATP-dependent protease
MIPTSNVQNLMLKEEVVDAVRAGRFHVWAVSHIDQGIEILTGRPAGERQPDGMYPEGTVHRLVQDRLRGYAEQVRKFGNVTPAAVIAGKANPTNQIAG